MSWESKERSLSRKGYFSGWGSDYIYKSSDSIQNYSRAFGRSIKLFSSRQCEYPVPSTQSVSEPRCSVCIFKRLVLIFFCSSLFSLHMSQEGIVKLISTIQDANIDDCSSHILKLIELSSKSLRLFLYS